MRLIAALLLLTAGCQSTWDEDGDKLDTDTDAGTPAVVVDADADGIAEAYDCDDENNAVFPNAPELCDGLDNDCDDAVDENPTDGTTFYADADGDGYGDGDAVVACEGGEGLSEADGDCDDSRGDVNPGANEDDCTDATDYNCDGSVGYADADGDGFAACAECDDAHAYVNPGAAEICDDIDNDCSGAVDDAAIDQRAFYADADADGYGDDAASVTACDAPDGYAAVAGDCDDADDAYNPGATEDDCTDPADYNCDGSVGYADADGDGWAACEDCDDADAAARPDATELCNGIDDDCDASTDEDDAADASTWYLDGDGDGYGVPDTTATACEAPTSYAATADDCDDADAAYNPGADESDCADPNDYNCDGSVAYADADADGYAACAECDDADPTANPGAVETCDGADDDCDGTVDEADASDASTWYADADGDSFGDEASATVACDVPTGYVADATDCDDAEGTTFPGAAETCDDADDDCDGDVDEDATDATAWFADADGDTYGDASVTQTTCDQPDGYVTNAEDCADADASVSPAGVETCDDVDQDCDGETDEDATDAGTWYADADGDAFGDASVSEVVCEAPAGYVADATDCDDADDGDNPGAAEVCDGDDDDCDGTADEPDAMDASVWYDDADGDSYGDASVSTIACDAPLGAVADSTDCDDARATDHPGADESCDGYDNDCDSAVDDDAVDDTTWYADADGDAFGDAGVSEQACDPPTGYVADATDCDDGQAGDFPGAEEVCDDRDNDCDGTADEASATDAGTWYADADADGYGSDTSEVSCDQPSGYVSNSDDCDDAAATARPGGTETCDDLDNDCDGDVDESGADGEATWYVDADGDGYGVDSATQAACDAPTGYAATDDDCDDTEAAVNPGATETDDLVDEDCDDLVDEDFVVAGDVVISEVTRQPRFGASSTNAAGQWFELHNTSSRTVDLSSWYVARTTTSLGTDGFYVDPAEGLQITPGGYVVLCKTDDYASSAQPTYSTLVCDYVWGDESQAATWSGTYHDNTFNLQRDEDDLQVYVGGDRATGTLVDEVHWYYATGNQWPRDATRSMSLDPAALDGTSNDAVASWCSTSNTASYRWWYVSSTNVEYGTPGAANYDCP